MPEDTNRAKEESSSKAETVDPPVAKIRENLVNTAIKFLQNPKVKESPLPQKRAFLSKKGLTDEEIDMAVQKSGSSDAPKGRVSDPTSNNGSNLPIQYYQMPVPTFWTKTRDVINFFVVVFGGSYMVYHFVKKYILPYLRGEDSEEARLERVDKAVIILQNTVDGTLAQIQGNLQSMQTVLDKQEEKLQNVCLELRTNGSSTSLQSTSESHHIAEIKAEITSLKTMLLNRRQFPPAPQTSPVIPTWQREKGDKEKLEMRSNTSSPTPEIAKQEEFSAAETNSIKEIDSQSQEPNSDTNESVDKTLSEDSKKENNLDE